MLTDLFLNQFGDFGIDQRGDTKILNLSSLTLKLIF